MRAATGKRASMTTGQQQRATMNDKSMQQMMKAATKRARAARALVMAMRVVGDKEGNGNSSKKDGDEGNDSGNSGYVDDSNGNKAGR
jgi:hypothetical protein